MRNQTLINDVDIIDLGCIVLEHDDNGFLCLPERIEPKSNNWYEYSGLDVDLSEIYFKEKKVSIKFAIKANSLREFEYNLSQFQRVVASGYISYIHSEFNRKYTLRYIDNTVFDYWGTREYDGVKAGVITVDFSLDDPLQLFNDPSIISPRKFGSLLSTESALLTTDTGLFIDLGDVIAVNSHLTHVSLNGIDLGAFGIIVNDCYSSMLKLPAVKKPLTRSFERRNGLLAYPSQRPTFEAKELVINCTMRADSRAEFYWNYEALFNNLTKPEALQVDSYLGRANCYYNKMENFKKLGIFSRGVLVSFTLKLIQIDSAFTFYVLGTASDTAILTDANEYILYQN